jgi:hypothetical protein
MISEQRGKHAGVEPVREADMPTIETLDELADLLERVGPEEELYVRWSNGPQVDLAGGDGSEQCSRDALTGITLPGLSANPLRVEPWWGDRSMRL